MATASLGSGCMFLSFKFTANNNNKNVVDNHFTKSKVQMKVYMCVCVWECVCVLSTKKPQMCSSNYQVFLGNAAAVFV